MSLTQQAVGATHTEGIRSCLRGSFFRPLLPEEFSHAVFTPTAPAVLAQGDGHASGH